MTIGTTTLSKTKMAARITTLSTTALDDFAECRYAEAH
jgi:hypothetical protein